jgi:hypothetical protein
MWAVSIEWKLAVDLASFLARLKGSDVYDYSGSIGKITRVSSDP